MRSRTSRSILQAEAIAFVAVCGLAVADSAYASEPTTLVFERASDASACPDVVALRASVVGRLGYDPFVEGAARRIVVSVRRDGLGHTGVVRVLDDAALPRAERSLHADGECTELLEAMALTISVALDRLALLKAPDSDAAPPPPPPAAPPATRLAPRRSEAKTPTLVVAGIGPTLSMGDAPSPVAGGLVYGAIRRGLAGAMVEVNATMQGSTATSRGRVSSWSSSGLVGVCAHVSLLFGCGMSSLGLLSAAADVPLGRRETALVAMVGPRIGLVTARSTWLEVRVHIDALLSLTRHRLAVSGQDFYEFPPGRLSGGGAVGVRF